MRLAWLEITGFRNYQETARFDFARTNCLIYGNNAIGKTNLLEAIYLLGRGKGFREKTLKELITEKEGKAIIKAQVFLDKENSNLLQVNLEQKAELLKKSFLINNLKKSFRDYKKRTILTVLFQPGDMNIITGSPEKRRSFFDHLLMEVDYAYYQARTNYARGLYKRNKILEQANQASSTVFQETILFWDQYLSKQAQYLVQKRQTICDYFNTKSELNGASFLLTYQPNLFQDKQELLKEELRYQRTMSGPQLDNFIIYKTVKKQKKELAAYGSRSEQRLAVLWLKINELEFINQERQTKPILLMDDIFSELDAENSERILNIAQGYQTIITTATLDNVVLVGKSFKVVKP